MRKVMDEMRENMRRTNPIEDLVHYTDSSFIASMLASRIQDAFLGFV